MKHQVRGAICALVLCLAGVGLAQDSDSVSGSVVSVNQSTVVIRTDDGETMTFARDAMSIVPASLAAGAQVEVNYTRSSDGTMRLTNVTLDGDDAGDLGDRTTTGGSTMGDRSTTGTVGDSTTTGGTTGGTTGTLDDRPAGSSSTMGGTQDRTTTGTYGNLPGTASPMLLIALGGLLSLGGGLALRARRHR